MKLQLLAAALALLALTGCKDPQATPSADKTPATAGTTGQEVGQQPKTADDAAMKAAASVSVPQDSRLRKPNELTVEAPAEYKVRFDTTKGPFVLEVHRDWAPKGADRFYNLVENGFYDHVAFFRAVPNFMVQFGIHGDPGVASVWRNATFQDDEVKQSNRRSTISFATSGPNSRTTQVFVNYKDNGFLDKMGFAPFGMVIEGMDVVDALYQGYGEGAPRGKGPDQAKIQSQGNPYLVKDFPNLDYIKTAKVVK